MGIFDFLKRDKDTGQPAATPASRPPAASSSTAPRPAPSTGGAGKLPEIDSKGVPKFFQKDGTNE